MRKKFMALLLTFAMVVTLIPAMSLTAFANSEFDGNDLHLVLSMSKTNYSVGDDIVYSIYAEDDSHYTFVDELYNGTDYELQYRRNGGSWKTLYDARSLKEGNYELIAHALSYRYHFSDPASNIVYFQVSGRRHELIPLTIYAPTLYINVGDAIPSITYRYTVSGLEWEDDVDEVLDFEPTLRYASTPSSKKAGTYRITFREYPDVNYHFNDKYYIAGYMDGSLVVKDDKSQNERDFESFRTVKANKCDSLYKANDSSTIKNLATTAKSNILNTKYNKSKSLQWNCDVVDAIYDDAAKAIKKERDAADETKHVAEVKAIKPEIDDIEAIKKGAKIYITKDTYHEDDGEDVETYQIARATKKNGTYKIVKTVTNTDSHKRTIAPTVKKLKSGKVYYFKVRGVVTLNGKKVYTKWSTVESVETE